MFSAEEYDIMIDELLYRPQVSFDMLCYIAEKTLRPTVNFWCKSCAALSGGGYEDELMSEIHLRLVKTAVDYFLLGDGAEGGVADDYEQFGLWLLRVATNTKERFVSQKFRSQVPAADERERLSLPHDDEFIEGEDRIAKLSRALSVVIRSDKTSVRVIVWLCENLFVLDRENTRQRSRMQIIEAFEDKTLYEIRDLVASASLKLPWLSITADDGKILDDALSRVVDGRALGEMKLGEVIISTCSRRQISEWFYEMDSIIGRFIGDGTSEC